VGSLRATIGNPCDLASEWFTAIVRGKGDTTGVALVEVYNLD
jgi:hypothetical protein